MHGTGAFCVRTSSPILNLRCVSQTDALLQFELALARRMTTLAVNVGHFFHC
jgi:hypothetical protein